MKFTKMQGTGNDYVYINCFEETVEDPAKLAVRVSDRHFGIGSDGLILICPSETADCRMRMFNADGSESAMCGNGVRCVAKYAYDHGIVHEEAFSIETGDGIKQVSVSVADGKASQVTVDMGEPRLTSKLPEPICVNGNSFEFVGISMGNPHAVYVVDDVDRLDLEAVGPAFETHGRFPERTNTEFIKVISPDHIQMRVWERGSGETWACGTGATAAAAAMHMLGLAGREITVSLKGGDLKIRWDKESNHIYMTGPAVEVFYGELLGE